MSAVKLFHLRSETNLSCPDFKGENYKASFHARSSAKGPRKKIYRAHLDGQGPRNGEHAVVKLFRHAPGTQPMCDAEIAKHVLARRLSRKFNKMVPEGTDKIAFTLPLKSTVEKYGVATHLFRHSRHLDKQEWVLIEENLVHDQKFELFLRKNGERAGKDPTSLDAFVHFTYMESGQQFAMCGFQGVHSAEGGYRLTTPCLHSVQRQYGQTDKGRSGIRALFAKHRCNNLCYGWPKPTDHLSVDYDAVPLSDHDSTDEGASSCDDLDVAKVNSSVTFAVASSAASSREGSVIEIGQGESSVEIGQGESSVEIGQGGSGVEIGQGESSVEIGQGESSVEIGQGESSVEIGQGESSVEIGQEESSVEIGQGGSGEIRQGEDEAGPSPITN